MGQFMNRCYRLRHRPKALVSESDLEFLEEPVPRVKDTQALVHTLWLSLDPANRVWLSLKRTYTDPLCIGDVMRGVLIGEVDESRAEGFARGDLVTGVLAGRTMR